MLKLHIMKKCDSRGTRDFFIIDEVRNTVEFGSSHATKYDLTTIYNEKQHTARNELVRAFRQHISRGYKEL